MKDTMTIPRMFAPYINDALEAAEDAAMQKSIKALIEGCECDAEYWESDAVYYRDALRAVRKAYEDCF